MALTRQQILLAALGILDEYGLADLSMRRLSTTLGVQAGALYHHFPDKQTLLAGLADLILAEVSEPLGTWRPAVEAWAGDGSSSPTGTQLSWSPPPAAFSSAVTTSAGTPPPCSRRPVCRRWRP